MSTQNVDDDTLGSDDVEFIEWARRLGVKPEALRQAIDAVGSEPDAVQAELDRRSRAEPN